MNTESLWTRLKQGVKESASAAAVKAEHLGKLGRARLDIAETRHAISDVFTQMGGLLYDHIQSGADGNPVDSARIQELADRVKGLEAELEAREAALGTIRSESGDPAEPSESN